jgi:hypothetical protein
MNNTSLELGLDLDVSDDSDKDSDEELEDKSRRHKMRLPLKREKKECCATKRCSIDFPATKPLSFQDATTRGNQGWIVLVGIPNVPRIILETCGVGTG